MFTLTYLLFFFFNDTATPEIYTLSLHDALPISAGRNLRGQRRRRARQGNPRLVGVSTGPKSKRSEEHTSELQSLRHLVCRLLLEKKKKKKKKNKKKEKIHTTTLPTEQTTTYKQC